MLIPCCRVQVSMCAETLDPVDAVQARVPHGDSGSIWALKPCYLGPIYP